MLTIKNNIMAGNAARNLGKAYDSLAKSVERLSSGLRINSAKDATQLRMNFYTLRDKTSKAGRTIHRI